MKRLILILVAIGLLIYGFYLAWFAAPTEETMGDIQRIFYYHVPSAWTAFVLFFGNFIASIVYLMKRSPKSDDIALACAEVGVIFCTIVLVTGPLWAKPVWGIYWTWDARLTSTFVMWLIYISYLLMRRFSESGQTPVLAAALAVFGFLDVPIVYMSIRWWRTQHPQPVIGGAEGSGIDPHMRHALYMNWLAFMFMAWLITTFRYRLAERERLIEEKAARKALQSPAAPVEVR